MASVGETTHMDVTGKLKGKLGVFGVIVMVVAAAAPLSTIGGVAPVAIIVGNGAAFPAMYVIAGIILALFVVGFNAMTPFVKEAGAFYSYITMSLGRGLGLSAAYIAMLTYICVEIAVIAVLGAVFQGQIVSVGGPDVPWWAWTGIFLLIVLFLGYRRIDLSGKLLALLVVLEIGICMVLVIAVVVQGGSSEGLSTAAFTPSAWLQGAPALGLMFGISGFLGFEATAIFRSEAKDPDRTIGRATYGALAIVGIFYAVVCWAMVSAWGDSNIVAKAEENPGALLSASFGAYVGPLSEQVVQWLLITSFFACVVAFHNVINRYLYTLSHKNLMPKALGRTHSTQNSPHIAAVVQTIVIAVLLAIFAGLGYTPFDHILTVTVGVSTLGFLLLMFLTCIGVLVFFSRDSRGVSRMRTTVLPLLGAIALGAAVVTTLMNMTVLVASQGLAYTAIGVIVICVVIGPILAAMRPSLNADVPAT
ncbi:MAG: APC family permease [Candidatus Nanopelagicales bacterium]